MTRIAASPEACFDLARDVDVHARSLAHTSERVTEKPEGRSLLELGDAVTFEGRHVGILLRHRARITAFDRPRHFRDEMLSGRSACSFTTTPLLPSAPLPRRQRPLAGR